MGKIEFISDLIKQEKHSKNMLQKEIQDYQLSNCDNIKNEVNKPFYIIFELLLKNTLNDSIFEGLADTSFYDYFKILKEMA